MNNEKLSLKKETKLPVNPVLQDFNYDCGKATVKTLLKSIGVEIEEEKLQDILKTNKVSGTHPTRILDALRHLGLEFVEKVGATVTDIEEQLEAGFYCLVVYQAWGTPEQHLALESGHYSLAYGYDEENVHLADPSARYEDELVSEEGLKVMTKNEFDRDWKDQDYQGNIYDHWMVAVKGSR